MAFPPGRLRELTPLLLRRMSEWVTFLKKDILLLVSLAFFVASFGALVFQLCQTLPWLVLFAIGTVVLFIRLVVLIESGGLLAFLPHSCAPLMKMTIFEIIKYCSDFASHYCESLARVAMLAGMDLDDRDKQELLHGMDADFREKVFSTNFNLILPPWLKWILFGRNAAATTTTKNKILTPNVPHRARSAIELGHYSTQHLSRTQAAIRLRHSMSSFGERAPTPISVYTAPLAMRRTNTAEVIQMVNSTSADAHSRGDSSVGRDVERILRDKMLGHMTQQVAPRAVLYASQKASEGYEKVKEVVQSPATHHAAAGAIGGGILLGGTTSAFGTVTGTCIGATVGLVPAIFTFGLSIPVFAIGGGVGGMLAGASIGGSAGVLAGGTLGYHYSPKPSTTS